MGRPDAEELDVPGSKPMSEEDQGLIHVGLTSSRRSHIYILILDLPLKHLEKRCQTWRCGTFSDILFSGLSFVGHDSLV